MVSAITALHQAAMMGLGFMSAAILLGGPLGVVPATAGLLAEARRWRDGPIVPGAFKRIWSLARRSWRAALPGGLMVGVAIGAVAAGTGSGRPLAAALGVVVGLWLLMGAHHRALLLSLGGSGGKGGRGFLLCAWWQLVALALWVLMAALTASPILPLGLAFGPSVVALLLVVIEGPAVRALAALPAAENV